MKITNIRLFQYSLPFTQAVQFKSVSYSIRTGYILKITNDMDISAYSDIAPLPQFSSESLEDAKIQIEQFTSEFRSQSIPTDILSYTANLFPSVRFGIESALLLMTASSKKLTLCQLLNPNAEQIVPVNALLHGVTEQIEQDAAQKLKEGYTSFKLKVGRHSSAYEIDLVKKIRSIIGPSHALRLDANQAFTYEIGLRFLESVQTAQPEYIEEPFKQASALLSYLKRENQPVPIALDESLVDMSPAHIQQFDGAAALILKPMLLGYTKTMLLAREALKFGMKPVISSSFESSIGIYILASMAAIIDHTIPAGLDTLGSFEADIVSEPIMIRSGKIDLTQYSDIFSQIDFSKLNEVSLG